VADLREGSAQLQFATIRKTDQALRRRQQRCDQVKDNIHPDRGSPAIVARFDGQTLERDVIDPKGLEPLGFVVLEDGSPCVLERRENPNCIGFDYFLATRGPDGWHFDPLPPGVVPLNAAFAHGPGDQLYTATWDAQSNRLLLWQHNAGEWKGTAIADEIVAQPTFVTILVDSREQPVVILGKQNETELTVDVFRRRAKQ